MAELAKLYARHEETLTAEISGERILLNGELSYFRLDSTGSVIWDLLQGPQSLDSIVQVLIERFDVDEPTARADVEQFLASLAAIDCLVTV